VHWIETEALAAACGRESSKSLDGKNVWAVTQTKSHFAQKGGELKGASR